MGRGTGLVLTTLRKPPLGAVRQATGGTGNSDVLALFLIRAFFLGFLAVQALGLSKIGLTCCGVSHLGPRKSVTNHMDEYTLFCSMSGCDMMSLRSEARERERHGVFIVFDCVLEHQPNSKSTPIGKPPAGMFILAIALLVCAVASLSVLAKGSAYLPKSHPARQVSMSKMDVTPVPSLADDSSPRPLAKIAPPSTIVCAQVDEPVGSPMRRLDLTVCIRHHSPPSFRA
jgi:hypothetical protein